MTVACVRGEHRELDVLDQFPEFGPIGGGLASMVRSCSGSGVLNGRAENGLFPCGLFPHSAVMKICLYGAGSIGGIIGASTPHQYFSDKGALLHALAEREMRLTIAEVAKALRDEGEAPLEERVRAVVRAIVHAFHGRQRARKAVVQAVLAQGMAIEMVAPVAAFIAEAGSSPSTRHRAPQPRAAVRRLARPDGRDPRRGARGSALLQEPRLRGRIGPAGAFLCGIGVQADDDEAFLLSRESQAIVERHQFQRRRPALGGHERRRKLEAVGGAQRMHA